MKRNLLRRVETAFPIEQKKLKNTLIEDLNTYLTDNNQAWILSANGRYHRIEKPEQSDLISAQTFLLSKLAKKF